MSTIVGIATAPGIGGIGIIRMSGEKTFEILDKIFIPKTKQDISEIKGYSIKYGNVVENNKIIDEVLVSYFKAPKSYTTENMCEINAHGGNIVVKKILELCLANGAEMAGPGEFTKRAFFNGRIDLAQAESVIDVINAKSEREAKSGIKQLEGFLSAEINQIKQDILDVLVNIEVTIDYPEYDDIEVLTNEKITPSIKKLLSKITNILNKSTDGKIIKDGINIGIIGRPNVGKSSLLNALLEEQKAIVTDIEGTTRDIVEGRFILNGIVCNIIDTAGIRKTDNLVEQIGVAKSYEIIDSSDLVIYLLNNNEPLTKEDQDLLDKIKSKKHIIVINKIDLSTNLVINDSSVIKMSLKKNIGLDELKQSIIKLFNLEEITTNDPTYLTSARSIALLKQAKSTIEESLNKISTYPIDIVELDLKEAWSLLGEIIGKTYKEELIDEMFSRFCLGK